MNKKYEKFFNSCKGRGCTLDEYIIPKAIFNSNIFYITNEVYRDDISRRNDIQKILSIPKFDVDKIKEKEEYKNVA